MILYVGFGPGSIHQSVGLHTYAFVQYSRTPFLDLNFTIDFLFLFYNLLINRPTPIKYKTFKRPNPLLLNKLNILPGTNYIGLFRINTLFFFVFFNPVKRVFSFYFIKILNYIFIM